MNQIDERTRRALCAADQPPPGVEDRVLAAIVGPLGGGPGSDGGVGASQAPAVGQTTLAYAAKVVGATLGLAAAGVVLVAVTATGIRTTKERSRVEGIEHREVSAPAPSRTSVADQESQPDPEPLGVIEASADSVPVEPAPAPAPAPADEARSATSDAPEQGVEAELALMKLARGSSNPKAALRALEQHRDEYPDGVFAAEREVLRIESLCALGRTAEAKTVAAAFIAGFPSNPLRSRVEPACPK